MKQLSSFVRFDSGEVFERDYYITHTSKRRFTLRVIVSTIGITGLFLMLAMMVAAAIESSGFVAIVLLGLALLAAALVILYFCLRRPKVSHGYAAVTNKRLIYYEFNDHPTENYQAIKSVHLDDMTGIIFRTERTLLRKSFYMVVYTSKKGMEVGAVGYHGWWSWIGTKDRLEPGPDALVFIQDMTGAIAARKFLAHQTESALATA